MIVVSCPSCGARVEFKSSISILAVCEHCRSTLVRKDINVENIGVMAEIKADASPIQLGVEGKYAGVHFTVIGRIQMEYESGVWNEWHLWFDDGRTGWLSDAQCLYAVTFVKSIARKIPLADLTIGKDVGLEKSRSVVNIEQARCIAVQGELPFNIEAGYKAPVVDLHGDGTAFGTLDYSESETEPIVFLGEYIDFADLHFAGLRQFDEEFGPGHKAKTFRCPQCGASISVRGVGQTVSAVCSGCNSIIDITDEDLKTIKTGLSNVRITPLIALGTVGTFRGNKYEVLGFQRRSLKVEGVAYRWDEYLLFNPYVGFRWLTEYRGHWNFVHQTLYRPAKVWARSLEHRGLSYRHFQTADEVRTEYVLGEFYWRVQSGETYKIEDYVAPPEMLSIEKSGKEVTWSIGTYIEPTEIQASFRPTKLPARLGVYANQPSPYAKQGGQVWVAAAVLFVLAILIQGAFAVMAQNKRVLDATFAFTPNQSDNAHVTPVFDLDGRSSNVVVRSQAGVGNSWVLLNMALVNEDTGTAYDFGREISYYFGSDSDGAWTEGSTNDEAVLPHVPAGHYYLRVEPEGSAQTQYSISVYRDVPQWTPLLITLGLLFVFPLVVSYRKYAFERERWSESDHPWGQSKEEE